ncbi:hypothetical protein D1731_09290 [Salmonella enterica subsp. enterica serovar Luke]|nr:hypothetical protein [Salmonella enterica subsp. enterica serovar Luke]EBH8710446.1 hypothetical protein [Salmonella enterica subsp. enterica serovar Luke]
MPKKVRKNAAPVKYQVGLWVSQADETAMINNKKLSTLMHIFAMLFFLRMRDGKLISVLHYF